MQSIAEKPIGKFKWNSKEGSKVGTEGQTLEETKKKNPPNNLMVHLNPIVLLIVLNIVIKRHRFSEWIRKARPKYMLSTRDSL